MIDFRRKMPQAKLVNSQGLDITSTINWTGRTSVLYKMEHKVVILRRWCVQETTKNILWHRGGVCDPLRSGLLGRWKH